MGMDLLINARKVPYKYQCDYTKKVLSKGIISTVQVDLQIIESYSIVLGHLRHNFGLFKYYNQHSYLILAFGMDVSIKHYQSKPD